MQAKGLTRRAFLKRTGIALVGLGLGFPRRTGFSQMDGGGANDLVFVSNTGDGTLSIIDSTTDEVVKTIEVGTGFSFPANKWAHTGSHLWGGIRNEVIAIDLRSGDVAVRIETGSKQNYTEITPDGRYLVNAARFTDTYQLIGADPSHPDFGTVVAQYNTYANAGPCDMTIREDGRYAFDPDRHSDAIAVLDLNSFEVVAVVPVEPLVGDRPDPFMGTISPDGRFFFVENTEGDGTESVWDVSDPLNPVELKRFTQQDGLGLGSLTDEFTPDGRFNFIINRSSSDLNVVDLNSLEIVDTIAFPPGSNPVTGDFSVDGHKFYVTLPGRDAVAVIDVAEQRVIDTVKVGPQPVGVIAQRTTVPETAGVDRPLGLAYQTGRQFDENCPFACCGKV